MPFDGINTVLIPPTHDRQRLHPQSDGEVVYLSGDTMGTSWSIVIVCAPGLVMEQLQQKIEHGFKVIVAQMSQWEAMSELSRYNRASPGSWHIISPQFGIVLQGAMDIARASDGAFDPTLGALSAIWGFGAAGDRGSVPTVQEVENCCRYNWRDVRYETDNCKLFQPGGLELDLSAIAKGFAVDYTAAVLEREGVMHALVEIGGELKAIGVKPNGEPWWIDLETPPDQQPEPIRIALSGWAIATTGHHLRRRSAEGQDWSHSLLPQTGFPTENQVTSVSVLHPQCMQADALATAIMVLGIDDGLAFADQHRLPVQMVTPNGNGVSQMWLKHCEPGSPYYQETSR